MHWLSLNQTIRKLLINSLTEPCKPQETTKLFIYQKNKNKTHLYFSKSLFLFPMIRSLKLKALKLLQYCLYGFRTYFL